MDYTIQPTNRRTILKSLGVVSTFAISGLAGCVDVDDETGDGMNGDGMDGDGMNGDGMDGDGMDGDGMNSDGMDGDGMNDDGMDGDGMNGDGMNGDEDYVGGRYEDAESISGSDYPTVDEWLTETEVGGTDDTYDGSIVDLREDRTITINVGAAGNGDGFAFGPSAVVVSAGTEFLWDWTGEGGQHNVVAAPDSQLGESDYVFSSGQLVSGRDNEYRYTFEESGIALYQCEPHLSLGMKGAVIIE